jgi:hypothetical protein
MRVAMRQNRRSKPHSGPMMRTATLLAAILSLTFDAVAQIVTPVAQTSPQVIIRGVVLDQATGSPLVRARIDVSSAAQHVATAIADESGRFSVAVPARRAISLRIVKAGYAALRRNLTPEELRDGEVQLQVPRGAVIAGRLVDSAGQPTPIGFGGVMIRSLSAAGEPLREGILIVQADEQKEFRLGGLAPGRYVVETGDRLEAAAPPRPEAIVVDLPAGGQANVDLVVPRREADVVPDRRNPDGVGRAIRGTVSTTRGAPIVDATVTVRRQTYMWNATTDLRGQFTIPAVPPGPVEIYATKRGYIRLDIGPKAVFPELTLKTVTVEPDRDVDDVSLLLTRSSIISGSVVDEFGDPLQDVALQLLRVRRTAAGLTAARELINPPLTDDRGQFKVSSVTPGDYILVASMPSEWKEPGGGRQIAYVPTYFPDTHELASAIPIRVGSEEDVPGLLLTMRRVPVARLTGVVRNSDDTPFTGTVRLIPKAFGLIAPDARALRLQASEDFVFADVPPGEYRVQAIASATGPNARFASASVTIVDRDPAPLLLRTGPASSLSGQLVLEGGDGELLWGYSVSSLPLEVAVSSPGVTTMGGPVATGEPIALGGLTGLTRLRIWSTDAKWYLKSILINGVDAADTPFDFGYDGRAYTDVQVIFSRGAASITGRATDDRAMPVRDYAVYVFPTDRDKWIAGSRLVTTTAATPDGTFKAGPLPPGEYWIAAVDRADATAAAGDWVDTERLDRLVQRATRIALGERQSSEVTLRVIRR